MEWPSGEATACKAVHTGSIPVSTSRFDPQSAISSAGERFPDTEEVTGSIPVSRTGGLRTSTTYFEAALREACALRVLPESAGLGVCSPPLSPLAA